MAYRRRCGEEGTLTAPDYGSFKLLNVAILALSALVGLRFLTGGMRVLNENVWTLLFGFVGTQLAWTLRPFFGSPGMKFSLYRDIDGNIYAEILRTLSNLF